MAALADGDWDATADYVDEKQVALLTSIEGVSPAETAAMLLEGIPTEVRRNFWRSFSDGFVVFSAEETSDVLLGDPTHFEVEGIPFGAVTVSLRHHPGIGSLIARGDDAGWRVDLFATFGPAFASPLRDWLAKLPSDEDGRLIRAAMAEHEASFATAVSYEPLGDVSDGARFEITMLMVEANS